jgi:phosphoserine phosphatase
VDRVHQDPSRLAILDADGTLYPGALGVELLRALLASGLCHREKVQPVFDMLHRYRAGEVDFATMSVNAYMLFAAALKDCSCVDVARVARETWQRERFRLFPFATELVQILREGGYLSVLISGSPHEIVGLMAEELGIVHSHGAIFSRRCGFYTGEVELASAVLGNKRLILSTMTSGQDVRLQDSLAIGDSLTDSVLLELVGGPVAFEPDPALRSLALDRGWTIADRDTILDSVRALLHELSRR